MDYKYLNFIAKKVILSIVLIFFSLSFFAQSITEKEIITSNYDKIKLAALVSNFEKEFQISNKRIIQTSKSNSFKTSFESEDGTITALNDFGTDGTPLYYSTFNSTGIEVSRASALHKHGQLNLDLDGSGMQVGIWDSGIALTTHQEFDGRAVNADSYGEELGSHATMVTGTIISSGIQENAKGVAYKATALSHDWTKDKIEVSEAAANGLLLSNHSYGISSTTVPDWYFGSYIKVSQDWDKIMYNAPYYLMVAAAGNSRKKQDNSSPIFGDNQDGFDLLLGFATAKNGLVIAGADVRIADNGELKEASVSSYSSFGPVDDSRIKPDLAGDGTSIYSTYSKNDKSYNSAMGTSMAAPGVTGALLLLQEYHSELNGYYMRAATLKGLALHTADDVHEAGPDYKLGWGVLNVKKAAEVLTKNDYSTIVTEESLENRESFSITVKASGTAPLKASISWTDLEGQYINKGDLNTTTKALINDLDIRITKNGNTYLPWKMSAADAEANAKKGDNKVDPFERIDIFDAEGEYTITVTHKGLLANAVQDFSLIVSGIEITECKLIAPTEIQLDETNENGTLWTWKAAEETLYEIQYKEKQNTDWNTELTWDSVIKISNLEEGKTYQFRLRSVCSENLSSEFSETIDFVFKGTATKIEKKVSMGFEDDSAITVFPNPAVSEINIVAEISQNATYMISTFSGNVIKTGKANEEINVSNLRSGFYIITVEDDFGIKSTKFFKR